MQRYRITLRTKDLFSLPIAVGMKQLEHPPVIFDYYDSPNGQLVVLEILCTTRQKLMAEVALKDYILGSIKKIEPKPMIADWIMKGWK